MQPRGHGTLVRPGSGDACPLSVHMMGFTPYDETCYGLEQVYCVLGLIILEVATTTGQQSSWCRLVAAGEELLP